MAPIPITVFTGFLGAGKTSVILSLLPRLPKDYKVVLLKNEFGDVEVDSQLAKQSSLTAVSEILNGCMCCVLVGQMKTALLEIREKFSPDRIIIECSGSAFPATLAFQIRELEHETSGDTQLKLDAIITVIDAENFVGYEDASPTAKMQASYTDIILINKWQHVSDRQLDLVLDHLHTLNDLTPKIRCQGRTNIDPNIIFGVESKLFLEPSQYNSSTHNDEVETVTVYRGQGWKLAHNDTHEGNGSCFAEKESIEPYGQPPLECIDEDVISFALNALSKVIVWRVKGFVRFASGVYVVNWAFGRLELTKVGDDVLEARDTVFLTMMGERGEVKQAAHMMAVMLGGGVE